MHQSRFRHFFSPFSGAKRAGCPDQSPLMFRILEQGSHFLNAESVTSIFSTVKYENPAKNRDFHFVGTRRNVRFGFSDPYLSQNIVHPSVGRVVNTTPSSGEIHHTLYSGTVANLPTLLAFPARRLFLKLEIEHVKQLGHDALQERSRQRRHPAVSALPLLQQPPSPPCPQP
ncbi:hypothetical protein [Stenotrophomonas oahuensis]|uniref:Uncharacterized protein n=1 Tax=Stenotrophomonas oahuensis TaxID=3003271 RepID=A0ABY9YNU4_9GAMM|nr:hypothetical protein [Stenotrophomonas sp. A5586]WNH51893.1 hypothetical protein PDM29_16335 [Stenotrophomonas sp. A5586]